MASPQVLEYTWVTPDQADLLIGGQDIGQANLFELLPSKQFSIVVWRQRLLSPPGLYGGSFVKFSFDKAIDIPGWVGLYSRCNSESTYCQMAVRVVGTLPVQTLALAFRATSKSIRAKKVTLEFSNPLTGECKYTLDVKKDDKARDVYQELCLWFLVSEDWDSARSVPQIKIVEGNDVMPFPDPGTDVGQHFVVEIAAPSTDNKGVKKRISKWNLVLCNVSFSQ